MSGRASWTMRACEPPQHKLRPMAPAERYGLFELSVEEAASTVYEGGEPVCRRWRRVEG